MYISPKTLVLIYTVTISCFLEVYSITPGLQLKESFQCLRTVFLNSKHNHLRTMYLYQ